MYLSTKSLPTRLLAVTALVVSILHSASGQATKPLTGDELVQMKKAGFDDQTILEAIEANGAALDTSARGLVALKSAGLSDSVIRAALSSQAAKSESASSIPIGTALDGAGVYVKSSDRLVRLRPETAMGRSSGILKGMASATTFGAVKNNVNMSLDNPSSPNRVSVPAEFQIRAIEGTLGGEYQLLRLEVKGRRREFRMGSSGFSGVQTGIDEKARVPVELRRVEPGLYQGTVTELEPGEYGWVQATGGLQVFTFRVVK